MTSSALPALPSLATIHVAAPNAAPAPANGSPTDAFAQELKTAQATSPDRNPPRAKDGVSGRGEKPRAEEDASAKARGQRAPAANDHPRRPTSSKDEHSPDEADTRTAQRMLLRWLAGTQDGKADALDGEAGACPALPDKDDRTMAQDEGEESLLGAVAVPNLQPERREPAHQLAALPSSAAGAKDDAPLAQGGAILNVDGATNVGAATREETADPFAAVGPTAGELGRRGIEVTADSASAESLIVTEPSAAPSPPQALPGFAAELARSSQLLAETASPVGPAAEIRLPTPVHHPQFVPDLCGELALLAREGVREAHVKLHPAELGPIAVQITLDGSSAQVRLAVDSAFTRDLLEQGLPTLAAAMRENGLTLSGGGVFQQPRDSARDAQDGARSGQAAHESGQRGEEATAQEAAARVQRLRHAGRLDVFA